MLSIERHNVDHHIMLILLFLSYILNILRKHQQLESQVHALVLKLKVVVLLGLHQYSLKKELKMQRFYHYLFVPYPIHRCLLIIEEYIQIGLVMVC